MQNVLLQLVISEVSDTCLSALESKPGNLYVVDAWAVSLLTHMQQTVSWVLGEQDLVLPVH